MLHAFPGYGALLLSGVIFGISMLLAGMASPYYLGSGDTATSLAAAAEISFSKMRVLGSQILIPVLFYYADAGMHSGKFSIFPESLCPNRTACHSWHLDTLETQTLSPALLRSCLIFKYMQRLTHKRGGPMQVPVVLKSFRKSSS